VAKGCGDRLRAQNGPAASLKKGCISDFSWAKNSLISYRNQHGGRFSCRGFTDSNLAARAAVFFVSFFCPRKKSKITLTIHRNLPFLSNLTSIFNTAIH